MEPTSNSPSYDVQNLHLGCCEGVEKDATKSFGQLRFRRWGDSTIIKQSRYAVEAGLLENCLEIRHVQENKGTYDGVS